MFDPQYVRPLVADQLVVLVAEDDAMVCNMVRIALEKMGMFVLTAFDGEEALELSRKFPGTIHAVVSDMVMPKLDGFVLCEQIRRERPATKVLLMSGTGRAVNNCAVNNIPLLQKPFMLDELKQKIRQIVTGTTLTPRAS